MRGVQPRGLKELHDHITGVMAEDPNLKNAFKLIPLWQRIIRDRRVQTVGGVSASVVLSLASRRPIVV